MELVREEAQASLRIAADMMKDHNGGTLEGYQAYKVGNKVWPEGKNLKTVRPKAKLDAKCFGPFTITEVIGNDPARAINFRLDIPKSWKRIHPVFHAYLLMPYVETPEHGPNFPEPPPELIDDEEEYPIEIILDGRPTRNKRGFEYLVKWEGYSDAHNMWKPSSELKNAQELIAEYHQRHPNALRPKNLQRS